MIVALCLVLSFQAPEQAPNTWVKRTPLADTPVSPRMGYEGDCAWVPGRRLVLRYGGHNQGGGGEQGSEIWTFDPATAKWALHEPNTSPPGICCGQQNVFDPAQGRYLRFPAFSASHGWQWHREVYLNNSAVWSYDLGTNTWRNLRPAPGPRLAPLRSAAWDSDHEVAVVFGGEGSREGTLVYDPYANAWTEMKPSAQPEFRSGGNMAYDPVRKVHLLFGAQFTSDPHTWAYDLRKNEWRDLRPAAMPFTGPNDAVMAFDAANGVAVAIVKVTEGKGEGAKSELQTWTFDPGKNEWKRMNPDREPDPSGNRARVMMFAPEEGLVYFENCASKPREQQIWTYRAGPARPAEPSLRGLRVGVEAGAVTLAWEGEGEAEVFRGAGERPWEASVERLGSTGERSYRDAAPKAGSVNFYEVRRGATVLRGRAQPRIAEDVRASVLSKGEIEIAWSPVAGATGYRVERAVVETATDDQLKILKSRTDPLERPSVGAIAKIGAFRTVGEVAAPGWTDRSVDLEKPVAVEGEPSWQRALGRDALDPAGKPYPFAVYAYRVRAVNALGTASGPSAPAFTIPSSPEHVFSREEGTTCHVKWKPNAEKGIRGYRVYRMDGRWDKDKVARLTPEPVEETSFSDPGAGKSSRRYTVIAVDALGQEGFPSSPVWHEREWKSFYKPFTGEWHQ